MPSFYLDTSALVKLYIEEEGTAFLLDLLTQYAEASFYVLALAPLEFRSAVRRREAAGEIPGAVAAEVLGRLARHLERRWLQAPVADAVLQRAGRLVDRHGLRALDALQLAGCQTVAALPAGEPVVFVCADKELLDAAAAEGFRVIDPAHPLH